MKLGAAFLAACIFSVAFLVGCGPPPPGPAETPTAIGISPPAVPQASDALVGKISSILNPNSVPTPTVGPLLPGLKIAEDNGCLGCHTIDGTALVGPSWKGLFGKTEELESGGPVTVDAAYLAESITDPGAKIVKGFLNVMITVPLTEEEISAVISYIETLE
jgi:cytochrome c2